MKNNKKYIAIAVAALMVGLVAIAGFNGTLAYLFDGANRDNGFTPALVNIAVTEKGKNIEGDKISYGVSETKTVTIKNLDVPKGKAIDCFIRARIVPMVVKNDTNEVVAMDISSQIVGHISSGNWHTAEGEDPMMRYFKEVVAPGEATDNLLDGFDPAKVTGIPEGCHLEIQIIADAVQADPAAAKEAGWPAAMIPSLNGN